MARFIYSSDRPYRSGIVAEDIDVGELVGYNGSGKFIAFDANDHSAEDFEGVADFQHTSEAISEDDEDTSYGTFLASEDDRASAGGSADGDSIKVKTVQDNSTDPAPDISDGDVVGVVDSSAVSGSGGEFEGRLVEEGYADNAPTTFNRSNDNFIPIGTADRDSSSSFDDTVRVEVRKEL